ncbi:hypothetical protein [Pantoea ananatis]|uniref:hypothetical protein n=1 Tax=Pantoea ananas TaxID=553 RepID=UPI000B7DDBDF|nr:hypothetical protein [Pantoea ananatis]
MSDLEHTKAIYYKDGELKTILPEDLTNPEILEIAKTEFLMDESESIRLRPRIQENKKPHFFSADSEKKRIILNIENDPVHNLRIDEILGILKKNSKWKIMISFFRSNNLEIEPKFILEDYLWDKEVHRITSSEAIVRHDIFGQKKDISMSIFKPWIAIEVINTHYPSDTTFDEMINLSKNFPFMVLFDIINTKKKNYLLHIDSKSNQIRPLLYIYNGSVWKGYKELKHVKTSATLKRELITCTL